MAEAPVDLIRQLDYAEEQSKYWTDLIKEIKAKLIKVVGNDEELTVGGKPVRTYNYTDAFRTKDFEKQEPVLYQNYLTPQTVMVLDVARLQRLQPDVWQQFRSRSFRKVT